METIAIANSVLQLSDCIILTINEERPSPKVLLIPLILSLTSICIPILLLFIFLQSSEGLSLGFFISCAIFIMVSGYMTRLYLWNKHGKEVFIINKRELITYHDYKYFKDNYKTFHWDTINILAEYGNKTFTVNSQSLQAIDKTSYVNFSFLAKEGMVMSKNAVSIQLLYKIVEHLNK